MNIGFFTDTYQSGHNGVEHSIDAFKRELEKEGHNVYIFAPLDEHRKNVSEENKRGIYRLQAMSQGFFPEFKMTFPLSSKVFGNFGNFNLDIVHSHTPFIMGFYANFVAFTLNIPAVHTYHTFYEKYTGHSIISDREKADQYLMNIVKKITVLHSGRCDHVIVPSKKMEHVLIDYGIKNEISVLPTGIDLEEFKGVSGKKFREKHAISKDTKVLLYAGRIAKEKNIPFLVDALVEIVKTHTDVMFIVAGKGMEKDLLVEKIEVAGVTDYVFFTGHMSRAEVLEIYAASDIFLFASLTDTQSLALSEAVASGLPVVMLEDKGLLNIIKDGINGFEVNSLEEFISRTEELLTDDDLRKQFSNASRKLVLEFDLHEKTDELLRIYKHTLNVYYQGSIRTKMKNTLTREIEFKKLFSSQKNKEFFKKLGKRTKNIFTNLNKDS